MTRKWHAKLLKLKGSAEHWQGAMAGMADPGEYADEILPKGDYSSLFVYMFRRFGIPENGSDSYKEIACWYLTTPDPAVGLMVSPRPSGLRYSFGYWVNINIYEYHSHDDIVANRKVIEPALKQAMTDLLTPTNVRDVFINAAGNVNDKDIGRTTCDYSKRAGFGVTSDYYEKFNEKPTKE